MIQEKTVLCVDDEEGILSAMRRLLRPLVGRVLTARGGEEGLRLARAERPDLIFLDARMPVMDGYDLMRRLREEGMGETPVVLLTGDVSEEALLQGLGEGCVYYIGKPFRNEHVRNIVRYLLGELTMEERESLELRL